MDFVGTIDNIFWSCYRIFSIKTNNIGIYIPTFDRKLVWSTKEFVSRSNTINIFNFFCFFRVNYRGTTRDIRSSVLGNPDISINIADILGGFDLPTTIKREDDKNQHDRKSHTTDRD